MLSDNIFSRTVDIQGFQFFIFNHNMDIASVRDICEMNGTSTKYQITLNSKQIFTTAIFRDSIVWVANVCQYAANKIFKCIYCLNVLRTFCSFDIAYIEV